MLFMQEIPIHVSCSWLFLQVFGNENLQTKHKNTLMKKKHCSCPFTTETFTDTRSWGTEKTWKIYNQLLWERLNQDVARDA